MKKVLLFHGTDLESAQNILQNGINDLGVKSMKLLLPPSLLLDK